MTESRDESTPVCQTCGHSHVCRCFEEPIFADGFCSYCGCSPGEDCDVHECLAHPSAVCRECDGAVDEECWRFNDGVKCEIGIHDPRCNDYHPFAPTGEPEQVPDLDPLWDELFARAERAAATPDSTPEPVTPEPVCRECGHIEYEHGLVFELGTRRAYTGCYDCRDEDFPQVSQRSDHPFAPTGEHEQVPDLGWEVSLAEKSVLARAAGYAAASIEGLEQGDAAFRLLETALDIYGRAVRAESEAQHEATKAYLAETAVAIEARASAAEEQVRVLTEARTKMQKAIADLAMGAAIFGRDDGTGQFDEMMERARGYAAQFEIDL